MSPVDNLCNFSPEIHAYSCPLYLRQSQKEPYRDPYSYKTNKIKGDLWYDIFVTCVLEPPAHTYIFQASSSFHPTCFHFVINQKVTIVTKKYPGELEVYDPPMCNTNWYQNYSPDMGFTEDLSRSNGLSYFKIIIKLNKKTRFCLRYLINVKVNENKSTNHINMSQWMFCP